jgi:hypothetical protein
MSENKKESLWKDILIAVIPLFFGSLLFGGILESYKHEVSSRSEIMNDFYRPMRETQANCQKTHNNLFLKYGEVAGTFQFMLNEFKQLSMKDSSKMTKEYQIFLESILSTHTKTQTDVNELEKKLNLCKIKLFREYEELALVIGVYQKFTKLFSDRTSKVDNLYVARKTVAEKILKNYDIKKMIGMLRNFLQHNFTRQELKNVATQKIDELSTPFIQHFLQLSKNEEEIFNVEVQFFEDLHKIFTNEISDRFERGFIAHYFF